MRPRRSPFLRFFLTLAAMVAVLYLARGWWLPALAYTLIHDDGPAKADAALVLAGDFNGRRILAAADLVRKGYVPVVLVSGPKLLYGMYESQPAIDFAVRNGCLREWFAPVDHTALSTSEEAAMTLPQMKQRGIHSFLLVTSNYHTGRSRRIFRDEMARQGIHMDMRTVAAPDQYFRPEDWWTQREGRKIAFFEFSKTFATAVGM